MAFCVWLLSLSWMFSRFISVAACVRAPSLFMAEYYSTVRWPVLFIHPRTMDAWAVSAFNCCESCCCGYSRTCIRGSPSDTRFSSSYQEGAQPKEAVLIY